MLASCSPSVLLVDFGSPAGQTAALQALLTNGDLRVIGAHPPPGVAADWLSRTVAEHHASMVLLSTDTVPRHRESSIWQFLLPETCHVPVVVAAQSLEPTQVRELLQYGLSDFILPPFLPANVLPRIWGAADRYHADVPAFATAVETSTQLRRFGLLGDSPAFLEVSAKLPAIATCDVTVLVCGETGTGKELIARAIHYLSGRRDKPFVPVDCAAIPTELAESELFGHERGAFTGAVTRTAGLVAAAREGTIFLDEVDALPLTVQAKLLRFLQQKEYRCLGSTEVRKADVRVVSATNRDLSRKVQSSEFREDLFYRLNVLQLRLPPLRERPADIALLARHFLAKYRAEFDRPAHGFSAPAMQKLLMHTWPGNVRELENVIQAAVALSEAPAIAASEIHFTTGERPATASFRQAKAEAVTEFEKRYIERMLRANLGNISEAARAAQKHRRAFWELIRKYRINIAEYRPGGEPRAVSTSPPPQRCTVVGDRY